MACELVSVLQYYLFEKTHLAFSPWPSFVGYCHRSSNTVMLLFAKPFNLYCFPKGPPQILASNFMKQGHLADNQARTTPERHIMIHQRRPIPGITLDMKHRYEAHRIIQIILEHLGCTFRLPASTLELAHQDSWLRKGSTPLFFANLFFSFAGPCMFFVNFTNVLLNGCLNVTKKSRLVSSKPPLPASHLGHLHSSHKSLVCQHSWGWRHLKTRWIDLCDWIPQSFSNFAQSWSWKLWLFT